MIKIEKLKILVRNVGDRNLGNTFPRVKPAVLPVSLQGEVPSTALMIRGAHNDREMCIEVNSGCYIPPLEGSALTPTYLSCTIRKKSLYVKATKSKSCLNASTPTKSFDSSGFDSGSVPCRVYRGVRRSNKRNQSCQIESSTNDTMQYFTSSKQPSCYFKKKDMNIILTPGSTGNIQAQVSPTDLPTESLTFPVYFREGFSMSDFVELPSEKEKGIFSDIVWPNTKNGKEGYVFLGSMVKGGGSSPRLIPRINLGAVPSMLFDRSRRCASNITEFQRKILASMAQNSLSLGVSMGVISIAFYFLPINLSYTVGSLASGLVVGPLRDLGSSIGALCCPFFVDFRVNDAQKFEKAHTEYIENSLSEGVKKQLKNFISTYYDVVSGVNTNNLGLYLTKSSVTDIIDYIKYYEEGKDKIYSKVIQEKHEFLVNFYLEKIANLVDIENSIANLKRITFDVTKDIVLYSEMMNKLQSLPLVREAYDCLIVDCLQDMTSRDNREFFQRHRAIQLLCSHISKNMLKYMDYRDELRVAWGKYCDQICIDSGKIIGSKELDRTGYYLTGIDFFFQKTMPFVSVYNKNSINLGEIQQNCDEVIKSHIQEVLKGDASRHHSRSYLVESANFLGDYGSNVMGCLSNEIKTDCNSAIVSFLSITCTPSYLTKKERDYLKEFKELMDVIKKIEERKDKLDKTMIVFFYGLVNVYFSNFASSFQSTSTQQALIKEIVRLPVKIRDILPSEIEGKLSFLDSYPKSICNPVMKFLSGCILNSQSEETPYKQTLLMLVGPPGTGKTHLVRCLRTVIDLPFKFVNLAGYKNGIYGESGTYDSDNPYIGLLLDVLLSECGKKENFSNKVLVLDEVDKVLASSTNSDGSFSRNSASGVNTFLLQLLESGETTMPIQRFNGAEYDVSKLKVRLISNRTFTDCMDKADADPLENRVSLVKFDQGFNREQKEKIVFDYIKKSKDRGALTDSEESTISAIIKYDHEVLQNKGVRVLLSVITNYMRHVKYKDYYKKMFGQEVFFNIKEEFGGEKLQKKQKEESSNKMKEEKASQTEIKKGRIRRRLGRGLALVAGNLL